MRTTKELLELLDANLCHCNTGLCALVGNLLRWGDISFKESLVLDDFISKNRPSKYSSISAFNSRHSGYYWEKGNRVPRRKWLNKHIKKL